MSRILITGANGFLGRRVVAACRDRGLSIRCTGRTATTDVELADYYAVDLANEAKVPELLDDVEVVIHTAGLAHQFGRHGASDADFQRCNVDTTANLMRACVARGVKRVVLVSSVAVYGSAGDTAGDAEGLNEDRECQPATSYARSKYQAEQQAIEIAQRESIELIILRPATLYGEGDPGNVGRLVKLIDSGRFVWVGRGSNRKTLVHVEDAADACILAATSARPMPAVSVFNIAAQHHSMREIVSAIADALGKPAPRWFVPAALAKFMTGIAARCSGTHGRFARIDSSLRTWLRDDVYNGDKLSHQFGFQCNVSLSAGIAGQVTAQTSTPSPAHVRQGRSRFSGKFLKRAIDLAASTTLLFAALLPIVFIALLIKLTSRGPVFYWSNRVGRDNRIFRMPKFRTMRIDTPQLATHLLTRADFWMTPIGRFLRTTSLDELPQLWSVLVGQMSLVGPRPALFNQDDLIALRTAAGVHELLPGITGWAQINGRDELPILEKVELDTYYLWHCNWRFDLAIIARTVVKVLRRDGVAQMGETKTSSDTVVTRRAA